MADRFRLKVVTPGKQFYEGEAEFVEFVTTEGEMGVYRNHIPMTAILAPGLLRIHEEGGAVRKAAPISGFAEVLPELVTILAQIAEWPHEIDEERAKRARERAEKTAEGPERLRRPEGGAGLKTRADQTGGQKTVSRTGLQFLI